MFESSKLFRYVSRCSIGALLLPVLFVLLALPFTQTVHAQFATGGTGLYKNSIFWVDWGTVGTTVVNGTTVTRGFNVGIPAAASNRLDITCTLNTFSGVPVTVYKPGAYSAGTGGISGDKLDDMYNIGGIGGSNSLNIGLMAANGLATFNYVCSATLAGNPFPLSGLVFAYAEAGGGIPSGEYVSATVPNATNVRIIDANAPSCRNADVTVTTSGANKEVRLYGSSDPFSTPECSVPGAVYTDTMNIAFLEGSTNATVGVQGGGNSAIALGAMLDIEFSEDIPSSYGTAAHAMTYTWVGGIATQGVKYNSDPSQLAKKIYTSARLGPNILPDIDTSNPVGGLDVDALPKTSGPNGPGYANVAAAKPGTTYTLPNVLCSASGYVAGWIDWNGNGAFEASEKSNVVQCAVPVGSSVTLTWNVPATVPGGFAGDPGKYLRLRTAANASDILNATGVAVTGEAEDYYIGPAADVTVQKSTTRGVGGPFTFTATNQGNTFSPVTTTVINTPVLAGTVSVPKGLSTTITESAATGFALTAITCSSLGAGTATPTINPEGAGGSVLISAAALPAGANPLCTFTNAARPTLSVTKTASQSPLAVGVNDQFYTITIAVANFPTVTPITLADVLPTGITTVPASITATGTTISGCSSTTSLVGCTLAAGAAVGNIVVTVPITVAPAAVSAASTNTVTIKGGGDLTCTGTAPACTGSVTTPVVNNKIDIVKSAGVPLQTGPTTFETSYTIVVGNKSPATAFNVQADDFLANTYPSPASFSVSNYNLTGAAGATCTAPSTAFTGNVTASNLLSGLNDLLTGQSCIISFKVVVNYNATPIPTTYNTAFASAMDVNNVAANAGYSGVTQNPTNGAITASTPPAGASTTDTSFNVAPSAGGVPGALPQTPALPTNPGGDLPAGVPTPVTPVANKIDVVKSVGVPLQTGPTSFEFYYKVVVGNLGTATVYNVQVSDWLANTFVSPATFSVSGLTATSPNGATCTASTTFNGSLNLNANLLSGLNDLTANQLCEITFKVAVNYNTTTITTRYNNAVASGMGADSLTANAGYTTLTQDPATGAITASTPPAGASTTDNSSNVTPGAGGIPGAAPSTPVLSLGTPGGTPTPVTPVLQKIDVVKTLSGPAVQVNATTFDVGYSIVVKNTGTVPATNVQAVDNLANTFASGSPTLNLQIAPSVTASGGASAAQCALNPSYGVSAASANLLDGRQSLPAGGTCTLTFTVRVAYPSAAAIPATAQDNSVTANTYASAPASAGGTGTGLNASDTSTNSATPPATAGGDTPGATPVSFTAQKIDVVKTLSGPAVQVNATTFDVGYSIVVKNTGTVPATNVQAVDNLANTFASGSPTLNLQIAPSVTASGGASAAQCALNPSYGVSAASANLLDGRQSLPAGGTCTLTFTVRVAYPSAAAIPATAQDNSVTANTYASAPASAGGTGTGLNASDTSTNSATPPATAGGDTPGATPVSFTAQKIDVVKTLSGPAVQVNATTFDVGYSIVVKNTGTVPATNVQAVDNLANTFASGSPTLNLQIAPSVTASGGASAAQCALNPSYGVSAASANLLDGRQSLPAGGTCTLTFTVRVAYPSAAAIPATAQDNSVTANTYASAPASAGGTGTGLNASDTSTNSATPPATAGGDTPGATPVSFTAQKIDVVKTLSGPAVQVNATTFDVGYSIVVKNTGTVPATNVQAVDNLANTFASGSPTLNLQIAPSVTASGGASAAQCALNPSYGVSAASANLLDGRQSLPAGGTCTLTFTVRVAYPSAAAIPATAQDNSVTANTYASAPASAGGTGTGLNASDTSTNSATPPATAGGDTPGATPVSFTAQKIDVVKTLSGPAVQVNATTFDVGYSIVVKNTGTVPATNVQAVDNLANTFASGSPTLNLQIAPSVTASGGASAAQCALNPSYGVSAASANLLDGRQSLPAGGTCTLTFTVRVAYPSAAAIPATAQDNSVTANTYASAPASAGGTGTGLNASDTSTNSATPPATAGGDTPGATPVSFTAQKIDVVKTLSGPAVQVNATTFDVGYSIVVKNTGTVPATNVQAVDNLANTFASGSPTLNLQIAPSVTASGGASAAQCALNPSYGVSAASANLLDGRQSLPAGGTCTLTFTVRVAYPSAAAIPATAQDNSVTANTYASAPASAGGTGTGLNASDTSTNSATPPATAGGDTPGATPVSFTAQKIDVVKTLSGPAVQVNATTFDVGYSIVVKNTGTVPATNVQAVDNLANTFASGSPTLNLQIAPSVTASGGASAAQCALNPSYGVSAASANLLDGRQSLPAGGTCTLTFTVRVAYPSAAAIPATAQDNSVTANTYASAPASAGGTGTGLNASDTSTNSATPPATAGGDTPGATPVSFTAQKIDVVKTLSGPAVQVNATTFDVGYSIVVKNTGTVPATNVQAVDNLANTFASGSPTLNLQIAPSVTASGGASAAQCALNPSYGVSAASANLLDGRQSLPAGGTCTLTFTVRVAYPSAAAIPATAQDNSVTANTYASAPASAGGTGTGLNASDTSTNSATPPATAGGDTPGATPVSFTAQKIDVVKTLSGPAVQVNATTFDVGYSIVVKNTGTVPATNVQAVDNLANTFASGSPTLNLQIAPSVTASGGASAAQCALNPSYGVSAASANLLDGRQSLPAGGTCTLTFTVRVAYPSAAAIPATAQDNSVTANTYASAPASAGGTGTGLNASDTSTNSATPPATAGGDTPGATPVSFTAQKIDVVKTLSGPAVQVNATTFDVGYSIVVKNTGTVPATNVQAVDNLANTFASGSPTLNLQIAPSVTASGGASAAQCALNPSYGVSAASANLLDGRQSLPAGGTCTLTFTVRVAYPSAAAIPATAQDNSVTANTYASAPASAGGTGTGLNASDTSTNSATPPATAGGDTPGATPVSFTAQKIDVVKTLSGPAVQVNATTFDVGYSIVVKNTGTVPATNVQAVDNLANTFASGSPTLNLQIAPSVTASGGASAAQCALNPSYGVSAASANLLDGRQSLPAGGTCTLTFTVRVAYPSAAAIPATAQDNSVTANTYASAPASAGGTGTGLNASDTSTNSATPPATAGGDTPGATPVSFSPNQIDIVKSVGTPKQISATTYEIGFSISVGTNRTPVTLFNVQANDNLSNTFPSPATFSVSGYQVASGTGGGSCTAPTATNSFTGTGTTTALLSGLNDLNVGESCVIGFVVTVNYNTTTIPTRYNSAVASAQGAHTTDANLGYTSLTQNATGIVTLGTAPSKVTASDISVNVSPSVPGLPGAIPAAPALPDKSSPGDDPAGTPTPVTPVANKIDVVKSAGIPLQTGPGKFDVGYSIVVGNKGTATVYNAQANDFLSNTYPAPAASYTVSGYSVTPAGGASCTAAASFTGAGTTSALLAGTDDLSTGQSCVITFKVSVTYAAPVPNPIPTSYNNALASGMGFDSATANIGYSGVTQNPATGAITASTPPAGASTTDNSSNVSPGAGGTPGAVPATPPALPTTPGGDDLTATPTPVTPVAATIGAAKKLVRIEQLTTGAFKVTFEVVVANTGTIPVANVQLADDLSSAFPAPVSITAVTGLSNTAQAGGATAAQCAINPVTPLPTGTVNLMTGTATLAPNASCTYQFAVSFAVNGASGPFSNQAAASSYANPPTSPGADNSSPVIATDKSDSGSDSRGNNPGQPGDTGGSDDSTPIGLTSAVSGSVWLDSGSGAAGGNRQRDPNEMGSSTTPTQAGGLAGWTAIAVYPVGHPQAGQTVLTSTGTPAQGVTDANGNYTILGLPAGKYQLRFMSPGSNPSQWGTPVNGEHGAPQTDSTVNIASRTLDITVASGKNIIEQSLPVDPSGVIYDALTRSPIGGAVVQIGIQNGGTFTPLPAVCVLAGQQGQTTSAAGAMAGAYRFDIVTGADPACPAAATNYTLQVTPPAGYTSPSALIPSAGNLLVPAGSGTVAVLASPIAPALGSPTTYYTSFTISSSSQNVVHNHWPLDPAVKAVLFIEKLADRRTVEVGDSMTYRIKVRNPNAYAVPAVQVVDKLPLGFKLIAGTSTVAVGTSPAAVATDPAGAPGPVLTYSLGSVPANTDVVINYRVRVGVGADKGTGVNTAQAIGSGGTVSSLVARATVQVTGGVFSTQACIIGKVYVDCNQNKVQDTGEPGIPGVRLYMEDGTNITTDENGQYSFCGVRPITHVIKVDTTTLPVGARLGITSSRNAGDADMLILDPKNGELHRADFREMSCFPKVMEQVQERRRLGPVYVPEKQAGKDEPWGTQFNSEQHKLDRTPALNMGGAK